jgi:hypothetical protein
MMPNDDMTLFFNQQRKNESAKQSNTRTSLNQPKADSRISAGASAQHEENPAASGEALTPSSLASRRTAATGIDLEGDRDPEGGHEG